MTSWCCRGVTKCIHICNLQVYWCWNWSQWLLKIYDDLNTLLTSGWSLRIWDWDQCITNMFTKSFWIWLNWGVYFSGMVLRWEWRDNSMRIAADFPARYRHYWRETWNGAFLQLWNAYTCWPGSFKKAEPKKINLVCVTIADCNKTDLTTSGNLSVTWSKEWRHWSL